MGSELSDDARLASYLAVGAGRVLLRLREEAGFGSPRNLRQLGDRRSHEYLVRELREHRPQDALLSEEGVDAKGADEEGVDSARRAASPRVWIVDPLDGTREFAEEGRTDWAVHVALWERGELTAGAVALPARDTVLTSADPLPEGGGPGEGRPFRLAVSRSRPPSLTAPLAEALGAELVPMGSAGVKIAAVLLGEADAYVHAGGQYEWDSAAPVAVARAHGFHASRIDGAPLVYNNEKGPWLPDLAVCRSAHRGRLLAAVQEAMTAAPEGTS